MCCSNVEYDSDVEDNQEIMGGGGGGVVVGLIVCNFAVQVEFKSKIINL